MRGNEKQWQGEARWGRTKQGHGTVTPGNEHTIESKRRDNLRKDILVQYCDLQQEAKDIRKRIEKTQARLNRIQRAERFSIRSPEQEQMGPSGVSG